MPLFNRRALAAIGVATVLAGCGTEIAGRARADDLGCATLIAAIAELRSGLSPPPGLSGPDPARQRGDFDPNRYFDEFGALRMHDGYTLDYVYHRDGLGGYPILYARPVGQAPYPDEAAYRAAGDHPDYRAFIEVQDSPQGYFQFAAFITTAGQFYLDWHANYNDWRIVCDSAAVEEIVDSPGGESFPGLSMTPQQQRAARAIPDVPPSVRMDEDTAAVTMVVFTKWGGFYRRTLDIARADHTVVDEQDLPLVDYDCGIAF